MLNIFVLFFFPLDLSAMANSVLLELHGLEWDLSLYCHMYFSGSWLSDIYVYICVQTSTARYSAAHPDTRSPGFSQSNACLSLSNKTRAVVFKLSKGSEPFHIGASTVELLPLAPWLRVTWLCGGGALPPGLLCHCPQFLQTPPNDLLQNPRFPWKTFWKLLD